MDNSKTSIEVIFYLLYKKEILSELEFRELMLESERCKNMLSDKARDYMFIKLDEVLKRS